MSELVMKVLFDFDTLFDLDMGLLELIKRKYSNNNFIREELLLSNDETFLKLELLSRPLTNPLTIIMNPETSSKYDLDDLYQSFLTEKYKLIMDLSKPYDIYNMIKIYLMNETIIPVIWCHSKDEEYYTHRLNPNLQVVMSDYDGLDLSEYGTIYIKNYYILTKIPKMVDTVINKNIMILRYGFNIQPGIKEDIPLFELTAILRERNSISLVFPYKDLKIPYNPPSDEDIAKFRSKV